MIRIFWIFLRSLPLPMEKEEKLVEVFQGIRDYITETLESTTLADVIG
jgi:hypothetical protein